MLLVPKKKVPPREEFMTPIKGLVALVLALAPGLTRLTGSATSFGSDAGRGCPARDLGSARRGKAERESRQQARLASYPDPAAVQFRDRLDDGETQTRSGRGFLARAAGSIEPVEDARQVLRRDPGAGIGHLDLGRAVAARHRLYGDRAVRAAVAQRVGE